MRASAHGFSCSRRRKLIAGSAKIVETRQKDSGRKSVINKINSTINTIVATAFFLYLINPGWDAISRYVNKLWDSIVDFFITIPDLAMSFFDSITITEVLLVTLIIYFLIALTKRYVPRCERFEYIVENLLHENLYLEAIIAEYARYTAMLLYFLFMITLFGCIAGRASGWPSWVSEFMKEYWVVINIAILVIGIVLDNYSTALAKVCAQAREAAPALDTNVSGDKKTLREMVALEAVETDMRNIPSRLFKIFVSGAIFGAIFFGGIFS